MELNDLHPAPGATKGKRIIGRGPGSGRGVRSGRGNKGDKARGHSKLGFEGGQTPLHRRLPKERGIGSGLTARGFNTGRFKTSYRVVNLSELSAYGAGDTVTPENLVQHRVIKDLKESVKILGDGKIGVALTVRAHKFSKAAQAAIEAAGGTAEQI